MSGPPGGGVFVDSNVFYSRTQRDWLGLMHTRPDHLPPFAVRWTEDVLADVIHHLRKQRPNAPGAAMAAIRDRIAATFETGRVTDFVIDGSYRGPDPHDAHVHAAAVACRAAYLLTNNTSDFPEDASDPLPYEVIQPDDFFVLVDDANPELVAECVEEQIRYWARHSPGDIDLVGPLERAVCPAFAARVRTHLQRRALRR